MQHRLRSWTERRHRDLRRCLLAACAATLGAPALAPAEPFDRAREPYEELRQCLATVNPQIEALLRAFPTGGPGLRASVARLLELTPSLADDMALAARRANRSQKEAIGAGMADASLYFRNCGTDVCQRSDRRIRVALATCADADTRVGGLISDLPTMVQGIPGFNNAGGTSNGCPPVVSQSKPGC
jgi:hypothetical protein